MDDSEFHDIRVAVRRFVRDVVMPVEAEIEEQDEIPEHIRKAAADMGLYGFALPEEYGGLGLTMEQEAQLVFELGYTTPSFRSLFGTNNGIAGHVLMLSADEQQKQEFLPKVASGEWTASFALTEAEAGSDPAGLSTSAQRAGEGWVINGSKRYITNAPVADVFMVFARTDPLVAPTKGISCFLVPSSTKGVTVGPKDKKMGQAGAWTADVYFDDVHVGPETLIGAEGVGYATAMACLAHGRLHIAALCVGLTQRLVDETVGFASDRVQGGKPIAQHQLIQALIADSQTDLMAGRALVMESARAYDAGTDTKLGPACAKYFASEAVGRVADRAVQVHGGAGYMHGVAAERFYRDVRLFRIYEGTSQIQQLVIARAVLKQFAGVGR